MKGITKPVLVLKIGTSSITLADGSLDEPVIVNLVRQISSLHESYHIILVSSGAVGVGKKFIKGYQGKIRERKAAAAIGNPLLVNKYQGFFSPYKIPIAQNLCERQHFSDRKKFLQLRETIHTLWKEGVIPIANENDVVSDLELKFSDNDELATLLAVGLEAEVLLLGTSVAGLEDTDGKLVRELTEIDASIFSLARKETSQAGLGGMISKLTFARMATRMGIKVVIFGTREENGVKEALMGKTGTVCLPTETQISSRRKWLASSSLVHGRIIVDTGAYKALQQRKSLLAVGVKQVQNDFLTGEVIELVVEGQEPFAVAQSSISSEVLKTRIGSHNLTVAHADDIVLI